MTVSFFGQLFRSIRGATALLLLLGVCFLALTLVVGSLTLLAWDDATAVSASRMLVLLNVQLPETEIDAAYLKLRAWKEVRSLLFALDAHDFNVATSSVIPANTPAILLTLSNGTNVSGLSEKAQLISGVQRIVPLEINSGSTFWQTPALRPILLTAFVVLLLTSLLALIGGIRRLVRQWRGELELLRLSGIARKNVLSSFAGIGVLVAGAGSVLAVVAIYFGIIWAQNSTGLQPYFSLTPGRLVGLAIGSLIAGLLIGVIASALGIRTRNDV